jgi:hypothetical protein
MKKIKILFYSHTIDFAGTWRSHERILLNLNPEEFDVYVFYNPKKNNDRLDFLKTKIYSPKLHLSINLLMFCSIVLLILSHTEISKIVFKIN